MEGAEAGMGRGTRQVSLQRKIEESDFENAQDMFGSGGAGGGAVADSGKFESWPLTNASKQKASAPWHPHAPLRAPSPLRRLVRRRRRRRR